MPPRRRKTDPTSPWIPRARFIVAFVLSPAVWWPMVTFVGNTYSRLGELDTTIQALRQDIARHDTELREIRARPR